MIRYNRQTEAALIAALAVFSAQPVAAQVNACNGDCYGVNMGARVASGSDAQYFAQNNGVTAKSVSASYTIPGEEVYSGPNRANASADLATGAVRASVDAFAGGGEAGANWFERVTFTLPAGVSHVDIPIVWRIEGFNQLQSFVPSPTFSAHQSITAYFRIFAFQNGHDSVDLRVNGCSTSALCQLGPVSEVYFDTFRAEANTLYEIGMGISLTGTNIIKDFSNTSFVNFDIPDGVILNSSSGVLLSQPIQAAGSVPEPASWAMLIAGFGVIGGLARRRRCNSPYRRAGTELNLLGTW